MRTLFRWLVRGFALLGLLLVLVSATPVVNWWTSALAAPWGNEQGEILIVPAAEPAGAGMIGASSYLRAVYAVWKWREHRYRRVVLTGHEVAPEMRDFLISNGIPASVISVENESLTTRENAVNVARLLADDHGRAVLLTSDFHSARALRSFQKAGIAATAIPIPDVRKRISQPLQRWALFGTLAEETVKSFYYRLRGWS